MRNVENEERVKYLINKGYNLKEVSKMTDISYTTISYYRKKFNLKLYKKSSNIQPFIISKILHERETKTLKKLSESFNLSISTISRIVNSQYVSPTKIYRALLLRDKSPISEIAKELNLTTNAIIGIFKEDDEKDCIKEINTGQILKSFNLTQEEVKEWTKKYKKRK